MLFPQAPQYAHLNSPRLLPAPRDLLSEQGTDEAIEELMSYLRGAFTHTPAAPNQFDADLGATLPLTPDIPAATDGSAPKSKEDVAPNYNIAPDDDPFKPYQGMDTRRFESLVDKLSPGMEELAKYGSSALSSNPLGLTSREIIKQLLRSK